MLNRSGMTDAVLSYISSNSHERITCPKWGTWNVDCESKHSCEDCEDTQFIKQEEMRV